jgi:hypothetical protein
MHKRGIKTSYKNFLFPLHFIAGLTHVLHALLNFLIQIASEYHKFVLVNFAILCKRGSNIGVVNL